MNEELHKKGQELRRRILGDKYVEAAANIGVTPEDVREVFMQAAVYCGIPAALDSFRVAEAVFAEKEAAS